MLCSANLRRPSDGSGYNDDTSRAPKPKDFTSAIRIIERWAGELPRMGIGNPLLRPRAENYHTPLREYAGCPSEQNCSSNGRDGSGTAAPATPDDSPVLLP